MVFMMTQNENFKITIIGSGTAGFISALMLKRAFPNCEITILSSSKIGIIGVGEGSTEHWREFMKICDIPTDELLISTEATHKYGIRFENWNTEIPDYFHSINGEDQLWSFSSYPTYMGFIEKGKLLTHQTASVGLHSNKIRRLGLHENTNQFHFDTFKLNQYFSQLCFERMIKIIDAEVKDVNLDEKNGNITSVKTQDGNEIQSDFWIDASGFSRVLMNSLQNTEWVSFKDYLLCDSAIAFPTQSDPNGEIRPYTRARAASSGWMWEIPTQSRRGNGYVFSSKFLSEEEAVEEAEKMIGAKIPNHRIIRFDAGYLKKSWVKNCCAVGLSSSFVEPLEASSIGSTIQQMRWLIPSLAAYTPESTAMHKKYNADMEAMMLNILDMVRLHYISDRRDTPFWREMANMPIPEGLQNLLDLWSERPPNRNDIPTNSGQLFASAHFIHVAQGQNVLNRNSAGLSLRRLNLHGIVKNSMSQTNSNRHNHELVDHAEALREIENYA
jgi:tryptophan halogenase